MPRKEMVAELLGDKDTGGSEPCAKPRKSGQQRSGGRFTDL